MIRVHRLTRFDEDAEGLSVPVMACGVFGRGLTYSDPEGDAPGVTCPKCLTGDTPPRIKVRPRIMRG